MFDIGFWELMLIGVIALLVVGPERLPKLAHTAGLWFGRMRRMVSDVKADIDKELKAEELKRVMDEQAQSAGIHEIIDETKSMADEFKEPEYLVKAAKPEEQKQPEVKEKAEGEQKPEPDDKAS